MRETRNKGYFQGGQLLYGYQLDGRKIIVNECEAEIVRYMYSEYAKGVYVKDILKDLAAKGITYKGRPFVRNSVYNILRNEKYINTARKLSPICTRKSCRPNCMKRYALS